MTQKNNSSTKNSKSSQVKSLDYIFESTTPKWYIIQTYVGFEDAVKRSLELKIQNLNLSEKIQEIFIPVKNIIKLNTKGARQEKQEKIYPGYIYLKMILDKEVGYLLQNTNYVSRIAGTGDFAVALEDGYIEKLKERLLKESSESKAQSKTVYNIGDLVKIIDGPFKEMQGRVSGVDTENSRLSVLLSIFDRETNVELDVLEVKKAL
jgi:transcriptional antiterminator NusG